MPPFAVLLAITLAAESPALDRPAIAAAVADALDRHGNGVQASVWLGGATGPAWFERDAGTVRPTASAIKAFYLVELFDRFKDRLDAPAPGTDVALADDHPAVSHFSAQQRADIRKALSNATVRHLGRVMIGTDDKPNHVYNAAANVITAVLGGPEELTVLIHKRDPEFTTVRVRRYMLRDRKSPGDNEATTAALAALWQKIAAGTVPGLDAPTLAAVRDALRWPSGKDAGTHYAKTGYLGSDPLTAVRTGWWETSTGPVVYVVMLVQPTPGEEPRVEAGETLGKLADRFEALLVAAGRKAAQSPRE